ncbi:MAG: PKD domain-containing protein [Candidatus Saccharimonadales bacterium]
MRISLPRIKKQKKLIVVALGLLLVAIGAGNNIPKVFAADCDANAILYCGFSSNQSFIDKVNLNNSGNGFNDLLTIYAHFGLTSSAYGTFVSNAKDGTMYRDGRVVVGSDTIITGGQSLGRQSTAGSYAYAISGKNYYAGAPSVRWASGVNTIGVKVLFDSNGTPLFTVMPTCGNPVWGSKVVSGATCGMLNKSPVSGKVNTYNFTATANVSGLAKITKYVYDFGDGSPTVTTTSPTQIVPHEYTKIGTFTAKLTVYASAPGGTTITATAKTCEQVIPVAPPPAPKVTITKTVNKTETLKTDTGKNFTYELNVKNTGNVVLSNVLVTDEAPNGVKFISTSLGTIANNKLTYTIPSLALNQTVTITITAKAVIYTPTSIVNKACVDAPSTPSTPDACDTASVTVNPPLCAKLDGPSPNGLTYTFVATGSFGEGVSLVSGDFDFGDGKTQNSVAAAGSTVTTSHTYAASGTYSAVATLRFTSDGKTYTAPGCRASVKPEAPPTPECKPGIPVGDIRCNPCEYDASIPKDDARCVAPAATLPNTGAGNVIALASAALVGGFLWYRHILFRRHKRAYLAADVGASPLPLAEPLESPDPLAATPLADQAHHHRLTLRRRRPF